MGRHIEQTNEQIEKQNQFIDYVNEIKEENNITTRELAKRIEVSTAQVSRLLNKERKLYSEIAIKMAKALNISLEIVADCFPECFINEQSKITEINLSLYNRIEQLNSENRKKVIEYIDFLLNSDLLRKIRETDQSNKEKLLDYIDFLEDSSINENTKDSISEVFKTLTKKKN